MKGERKWSFLQLPVCFLMAFGVPSAPWASENELLNELFGGSLNDNCHFSKDPNIAAKQRYFCLGYVQGYVNRNFPTTDKIIAPNRDKDECILRAVEENRPSFYDFSEYFLRRVTEGNLPIEGYKGQMLEIILANFLEC